jgi:hypothetical protein
MLKIEMDVYAKKHTSEDHHLTKKKDDATQQT